MFILRKTFAIEFKDFDKLLMLLYKASRTLFDRFEGELIVTCDRRDSALNTMFDLLALYRSSRLKTERY